MTHHSDLAYAFDDQRTKVVTAEDSPFTVVDREDHAMIAFPFAEGVNRDLYQSLGSSIPGQPKGDQFVSFIAQDGDVPAHYKVNYASPMTGELKNSPDTVMAWANKHAPSFIAAQGKTEGRELAQQFVARPDLSEKFPGLAFKVAGNRLAITGVTDFAGEVHATLKEGLGAKWVNPHFNKETKQQTAGTGNYWGVQLSPEKVAKLDTVLTIAAAGMIRATAFSAVKADHPAINVSLGADQASRRGTQVEVRLPRDDKANAILKAVDFKWSTKEAAYVAPLTSTNRDAIQGALNKVSSYMQALTLQPTRDNAGMSIEDIAKLSTLKEVNGDATALSKATRQLESVLSPSENAALATGAVPETERFKAMALAIAEQMAKMVPHVATIRANHESQQLKASLAVMAAQQPAPAQARGM